jgi:hypothetical protein
MEGAVRRSPGRPAEELASDYDADIALSAEPVAKVDERAEQAVAADGA